MRIPAFITPVLMIPVLTALLLTGCGGSVPAEPGSGPSGRASTPPPEPTPTPAGPDALRGSSWKAVELAPATLVPGHEPRLSLQADRIGVLPGCNTMGGGYRIDGDRLMVEGLISTMMACAGPRMAQETAVAELLRAGPRWTLAGDRLTLTAGEQRMVLVRNTETPKPAPTPSDPPPGPTLTPAPGQQ